MPDVIPVKTTLLDAINTGLSSLGEKPVSAPNNASVNVVLAKQIIEEVNRDVQSKGWWFNTTPAGISILSNASPNTSSENFNSSVPEEARRYISIRASRILQARFLGSEDLYKFSIQEEQVSYAVLTQAHVRNGGDGTSFNSFPAELKGMGIEEFMFLQGNAEEKLLTIRLATELNTAAKLAAETALIAEQENLIEQQILREVEETAKSKKETELLGSKVITENEQAQKLEAETVLTGKQGSLVDAQRSQTLTEALLKSQQSLTELEETSKRLSEKLLVDEQAGLVTNQAATEVKKALDVIADTTLKSKQGLLIDAQRVTENEQAQKVDAETTLIGKQGELTDAQTSQSLTESLLKSQQALTELENTLKVTAETGLVGSQDALVVKQTLTEIENALKVTAEAALITGQKALVAKQTLTEVTTAAKQTSEAALLDAQELLVDNQTATELKTTIKTQNEANVFDAQYKDLVNKTAVDSAVERSYYEGVVVGTQDTYRNYGAEMRMMGVQEPAFQQFLAYKKIEVLKDAAKLRQDILSTSSETASAEELKEVNKIMRFIGEPSANNLRKNSLMVTALRLLRDTSEELQGRGWWFNTEKDVELPEVTEFIVSGDGGQWDGIYAYNATNGRYERTNGNNLHYFSKTDTNDTNTVGTWVLASEHPAGVYDETFDSNIGTGAYPDPALFEVGTLVVEHRVVIPVDVLSVEANDYDTRIKTVNGVRYLYDLEKKSYEHWAPAPVKCTVIYNRALTDVPIKFLEYLNVRVAILLTELYPQSGIDIQRLPKMEAELRAYFKDREFDEANYSVFDNYDAASRIGINRNYDLI